MSLCLILLGLCNLGAVQTFRVGLDAKGQGNKKGPVYRNMFANMTPSLPQGKKKEPVVYKNMFANFTPGVSRPEPLGGGRNLAMDLQKASAQGHHRDTQRGGARIRTFSPDELHMEPIGETPVNGHRSNKHSGILPVDPSQVKANNSQVIGPMYGKFAEKYALATRKLADLQQICPIAVDWRAWTQQALPDLASSLQGPGVSTAFSRFAEALTSFDGEDLKSVRSTWKKVLRIIQPHVQEMLLGPLETSLERKGFKHNKRKGIKHKNRKVSRPSGLLQLSNRTKVGRFLRMFAVVNLGFSIAFYFGGEVEVGAIFPVMVDTQEKEWWWEPPDIGFGVSLTGGAAQGPGVQVMIQIGVCLADDFMGWGKGLGLTTGTIPLNGGIGFEFDTDWTFEGLFVEGGQQWQVSPLNQFVKVSKTFTCCGLDMLDCFRCMQNTWQNTEGYGADRYCQAMAAACDALREDSDSDSSNPSSDPSSSDSDN